jgi:membrane-bound serine protease (ClpP class)
MELLIADPFYAVLFLGLGVLFLFLEVFIPSGGILGILSMGCAIFGVYCLFHQGRPVLGVTSIALFVLIAALGVKYGLSRFSFTGSLGPVESSSVDERIENLVGKEGTALTPLRPAGMALIEGHRVDVVAQGSFLDVGAVVRVINTAENRVLVRLVRPPTPAAGAGEASGGVDAGGERETQT